MKDGKKRSAQLQRQQQQLHQKQPHQQQPREQQPQQQQLKPNQNDVALFFSQGLYQLKILSINIDAILTYQGS